MSTSTTSTPTSVTVPVHPLFDALLNDFTCHLKDGFEPSEVSPSVWKAHFAFVEDILDTWKGKITSARSSFVTNALKSCFYEARRADAYVTPKSAPAAFAALADAFDKGFLLDIVLADGPAPDVKWQETFTSPTRASPGPRVTPPPSPLGRVTPPKSGSPLPIGHSPAIFGKLSSGSSSSSEESSSLEEPLSLGPKRPASHSPSGKFLSYAPVCKSKVKVYKLENFLPKFGYQHEDEQEAVIRDGKLKVKSKRPRVSSSHMWIAAMTGLGRHLASLPDPGFQWEDFSLYTDLVLGLFASHTLDSVLAFDFEYRKWRRAYGLPWVTDNPYLRTHLLRPKTFTPTYLPESDKSRNKEKGFCRDFNKGGCKRSSCRFSHTCAWCSGPHSLLECKSAPKGQN